MAESKVKILYCITKSNWGGAQRYVYDLAKSLPTESYDIAVLAGNQGPLTEKLKEAGVKILTLASLERDVKLIHDIRALVGLIKVFKKERPDIIHLNSSKMGLLGGLAGRITHVPKIIFTGHGWAFNEERSTFQKKIIYFLHLLTIRLSNKTIMVSEKTKDDLVKDKNKKLNQKIVIIKNGIKPIEFLAKNEARESLMKLLPTDLELNNRPWLGTISELHKNKGLKYLIEAMNSLKLKGSGAETLPVVMIIGEGEIKQKLQERINRYGLQNDIFLIGKIDNAARYLKALDIFTLTSITEALPYVVLEAGQAGLPIVASAVGGITEIIDDRQSGLLIKPKDPGEIEKAINYLLINRDKGEQFGQLIQERIKANFSPENMLKETINLYQ